MQRLLDLGFIEVGEWRSISGGISHSIVRHLQAKNLLYAFVCKGEVCYIGTTTGTLKSRMNGYKNAGGTQRTNIRVKAEIMNVLHQSQRVQIFIFLDEGAHTFKGYTISLAAGLETVFIAAIRPRWNYRGNVRIIEQPTIPDEENAVLEEDISEVDIPLRIGQNPMEQVLVTLGTTYWNGGFFNLPMHLVHLLPPAPTPVQLYLNADAEEIQMQGNFLFANVQGQPRIYGGQQLAGWFQANFPVKQIIHVDIINPTTYQLHA